MSVTKQETHITERMTSREKVSAVLRVLKGEPVDLVSAELGVSVDRLERWHSDFVAAGSAELSKRKSSVSQGWFSKQSRSFKQWGGLLIALILLVGLLALLLRST